MIKGVNKKIIEINNPESPYFDKVVLYIKPTKEVHTRNELSGEVDRYLKSLIVKKDVINNAHRGEKKIAFFILGMVIVLTLLIGILLT